MRMREFKFRAYDKDKKIMIYEYDQSLGDIYNLKPGEWLHPIVYKIGILNKTLMQFTGLKDKNGKEIYEGDVIKQRKYSDKYPNGVFIIDTIIFSYGSFVTKKHSEYISIYSEVIDNIYENSELLKDKNLQNIDTKSTT